MVTLSLVTFCFILKSDISVSSLSTHHLSIQMEIVNTHNDMRRMVKPTASNMLKMVSFVMLMDRYQLAFNHLAMDVKLGSTYVKYSNLFISLES